MKLDFLGSTRVSTGVCKVEVSNELFFFSDLFWHFQVSFSKKAGHFFAERKKRKMCAPVDLGNPQAGTTFSLSGFPWGKDLTFFLRNVLHRQKKFNIPVNDFQVWPLQASKSPRGSFPSAAKEPEAEDGNCR